LIRYLTNNSTRSPHEYAQKLARLGFDAKPGQVYTSALAAAEVLRGSARRAFVIGEQGLRDALEAAGIDVVRDDGPADAVVSGLCRDFDYAMMTTAMHHLVRPEVRFVATNRDVTFPLEGGRFIPGSGAIVAALSACSGREPEVVGKPNPYAIARILLEAGVSPSEALVVGDRVETDLVAGERAGCAVHLVLTGVTTAAPAGVPCSADLSGILEREMP
jgi:4-nitrophenyl phosphatase